VANIDPGFATAVLRGVGAPVTPQNIAGLSGWAQAEGGSSHNNPFNTTQGAPGATNFNGIGVKAYPNMNVGAQATIQTLKNGRYGGIITALQRSDAKALAAAIGASPWGTSGQLVSQTIAAALAGHPQVPVGGMARPITAITIPGTPNTSLPTQIGGGLNVKALAEAVLKQQVQRPIDTTGKVHAPNALADYVHAVRSGQFNAATINSANPVPGTPATGSLRTGGLTQLTGSGSNLNPLSHPDWKIGRTDMGVDANATPGTPIEAINDSKVVQIVPNWYAGQPLVLMQLTAGPDAGKYWYVSEQIAQIPHRGQRIARGQTVAVYAPSGTGIEIGWGSPTTNSRTAAGPHYAEGAVTLEGSDFLHHVIGH